MTHEIVYTSAPQGLKPGSFGFCTVAATDGIPPLLVQRLESLSGYRHLYPPGHPRAAQNPVNYAHLVVHVAGRPWHVLSRIADAGLDYSQRSNKLAHHVVLEPSECIPPGPAWILAQPGFCQTQFSGPPRVLPAGRPLPQGELLPARCTTWERLTGDAGWAGVLVRHTQEKKQPAYLIFQEGMELLPLLVEAQALLSPQERWEVTFATYHTRLPPGVDCLWRCVLAGSAEAQEAQSARNGLILDLTRPLGPAPDDPWTQAARSGAALPPPSLPTPASTAAARIPPTLPADTPQPSLADWADPLPRLLPPSAIEPAVGPPSMSAATPPPVPPPLDAPRGGAWSTIAGGLLVGLLLGVGGTMLFLRYTAPGLPVAPATPSSADLADSRQAAIPSAPSQVDAAEDAPATEGMPPPSGTTDASVSSSSTQSAKSDAADTAQPNQPRPATPENPPPQVAGSDPPPQADAAAAPLQKEPSHSTRAGADQLSRELVGWPLDKPPIPNKTCVLTYDLPPGTTLKDLSLYPRDSFALDSNTGDIKWRPEGDSVSTALLAATLTLTDRTLTLVWGPKIDTYSQLQDLLSHVIACSHAAQTSHDHPMLIPIWRSYHVPQKLTLRHCFANEHLYSFGGILPLSSNITTFPVDDLFFRFVDSTVLHLYGPAHDSQAKSPVSGILPSEPKQFKAKNGVAFDHLEMNTYPVRYTITLLEHNNTYVLTGRFLHSSDGSSDSDGADPSVLGKTRVSRILENETREQFQVSRKVIESLVSGYSLVGKLGAAKCERYDRTALTHVADVVRDVENWLKGAEEIRENLHNLLDRKTVSGDVRNSIGSLRMELRKAEEELKELKRAQEKGRKKNANESAEFSGVNAQIDAVSGGLKKALESLAAKRWRDRNSRARMEDESMINALKNFQSVILSREEMFNPDGKDRPQVSLELCRRVELPAKDGSDPREVFLPIVRFGNPKPDNP